ncbi:MAG: hypothetical protein ACE3JQ_07190 [Paenisporosarcina sp.]
MKIAYSLFSLLLFMNTIILFFQYQVYSSSESEQQLTYNYSQEVNVTYRENRFFVRHHFFSLPSEEVRITWPLNSENRACYGDDDESCSRLTDNLNSFTKGKATKQTISYEIPVKEPLTNQQLWKGVFALLSGGTANTSIVHLTDETKSGGMWLTGLPSIGKTSLSLVDYTLFNGKGVIGDLYWQKEPLSAVYKNHQLTLYANQPLDNQKVTALSNIKFPDTNHIAVIESLSGADFHANRIVFIPSTKLPNFEEEILIRGVQSQYSFSADTTHSLETLTSFLSNRAVGSEKSKAMYDSLIGYMTKSQREAWIENLQQLNGQPVSPELLDEWLSNTLNHQTSFFQLNERSKARIPLLFEETRTVYINELEKQEMNIILTDGRVLYSLEPMMSMIGYTTEQGENGFYIKNAARSFRFPLDEPFYVFNERRYDALSQPLEKIGDSYYIEESWLIRLFFVDIQKEEKRINISSSALF